MATNPVSIPVQAPRISKILAPVDFSEASLAAFWRAVEVAKIYNSVLWLLHVIVPGGSSGFAGMLAGALPELKSCLQSELDKLRSLAEQRGVHCVTFLREGSVVEHVREATSRHGVDLLVLATHGGCGFHGFFLGSAAERLIRTTTVPVLTVGIAEHQPTWTDEGARHILFAGDFSPETLCGLRFALRVIARSQGTLTVVRVIPRGTRPEAILAIRARIESLVPAQANVLVPEGSVGKAVCQIAAESGVDLIALGVHQNSFVRQVFGHSLLEILVTAPCPVLSVRQCSE